METFPRQAADEALQRLLGNISAALAVEGFVRGRHSDKQQPDWKMIVEYLSALSQVPEAAMELAAIISFWAAVITELEQPQGN